ncbi:MAG: PLP-dependent aminotransferase family protein [Oscillospiraceae bacterium]
MSLQFAHRMQGLKPSAIREILKFTSDPKVIPFAAGNPAPEAFPTKAVEKITADILSKNPIAALQYSISEGYPLLRETLKKDLLQRHNIGKDFDEIIITSGAQQAIELACKVLCNPDDTIICENPSFIGSLNSFRSYDVNLVGVDMEDDGINIEKLEQAMKENKNAKILYLIPNFQNPTGKTMSLEKRKACYDLCLKYNINIVEDNPYGELRISGTDIPTIKSLDTEGIVIYCGSFSKVLAPGLRVGYAYADKEIIAKFVVCKQASDVHTSILPQMICCDFMNNYDFNAHLQGLKEIYRKKCDLMADSLSANLSDKITFIKPQGGLFLWCTIPKETDMMDFCKQAVLRDVAVVPGNAFLPDQDGMINAFRVNYSTPTDQQIVRGAEILGKLSKEIM